MDQNFWNRIFTVSMDQFNASFLNRSIKFFQQQQKNAYCPHFLTLVYIVSLNLRYSVGSM